MIILLGETLSGEVFVGRNYSSGKIFVNFHKIRHFRPTKFRPIRYLFPGIKVKVSLVEVQMTLGGKKVI